MPHYPTGSYWSISTGRQSPEEDVRPSLRPSASNPTTLKERMARPTWGQNLKKFLTNNKQDKERTADRVVKSGSDADDEQGRSSDASSSSNSQQDSRSDHQAELSPTGSCFSDGTSSSNSQQESYRPLELPKAEAERLESVPMSPTMLSPHVFPALPSYARRHVRSNSATAPLNIRARCTTLSEQQSQPSAPRGRFLSTPRPIDSTKASNTHLQVPVVTRDTRSVPPPLPNVKPRKSSHDKVPHNSQQRPRASSLHQSHRPHKAKERAPPCPPIDPSLQSASMNDILALFPAPPPRIGTEVVMPSRGRSTSLHPHQAPAVVNVTGLAYGMPSSRQSLRPPSTWYGNGEPLRSPPPPLPIRSSRRDPVHHPPYSPSMPCSPATPPRATGLPGFCSSAAQWRDHRQPPHCHDMAGHPLSPTEAYRLHREDGLLRPDYRFPVRTEVAVAPEPVHVYLHAQ